MIRACALVLLVVGSDAVPASRPPLKWPLRATVTDLHGQPVAFQAVSLGGDLIVQVGQRSVLGQSRVELNPLPRGDTLRAVTPAAYPLDLKNGAVVFFTRSRDSIRVAIGPNPYGAITRVTALGRRLTVRQSNGSVAINVR